MKGFEHATSVVTGAASGIGRAFAAELGRRGGRVTLGDMDVHGLEETAEHVQRAGGRANVVRCDVTDLEQLAALADSAQSWADVPDLAVLNAGVLVTGPFLDNDPVALERMVKVNVSGVLHGCHIFGGRMASRGRGTLLNVGSIAGLLPVPQLAAYAATKHAVVGLSESLHAELREHGISVTVLCPSGTRTALVANAQGSDESMRSIGQRAIDFMGATPERVVDVALRCAARGQLYAVDTLHGRVLWRLQRTAPAGATRLVGFLSRRLG